MASFGDQPPIATFVEPPSLDRISETAQDHSAESAAELEDAVDTCRICRGEASEHQPLFYPCKCSGSIRHVHQECLMEWLAHSKKKYCELCKTPFRFTKLYDTSMPTVLPLHTFARQLAIHLFWTSLRWVRYFVVSLIWLVVLPWCVRQTWRGLFWAADGNWGPDSLEHFQRMNDTLVAGSDNSPNSTLTSSTEPAEEDGIPYFQLLSSRSLVARSIRLLFALPSMPVDAPTYNDNTTSSIRTLRTSRQSSLLSGMTFVESWTDSKLAASFSIDVIEGVLISLGLVASFILVFLIREWVINQQPIINNPEPAEGENANALLEELRAQRQVRRARRRRGNVEVFPDVDMIAATLNPEVQAARRRAMTDDNIMVPPAPDDIRPTIPPRAQSLVAPTPVQIETDRQTIEIPQNDEEVAPALLRGMVGDAIDARRVLEESTLGDVVDNITINSIEPTASAAQSTSRTSEVADESQLSTNSAAHADTFQLPTPSPDSPGIAENRHERNLDTRTGAESTTTDNSARIDRSPVESRISLAEISALQTDEGPSVTSAEEPPSAVEGSATEPGTGEPEQVLAAPETVFGKVAAWFWSTEGMPDPDLHEDLQHEQPTHDHPGTNAHGEAHPGHAGQNGHIVAPEAPRPVQLLPDDVLGGIDPNDPNALEDADEFEGVLELIGMEGPLIGMLQNVVFSLILISLTLSAALWIPYIWGKIGLILITNPITVLVRSPVYITAHAVDLVADVCFFVVGLLGLVFNMLAKVTKQATKPFMPSYSNLIDTETFEQLAINVTQRSGSRLEQTLSDAITMLNPDMPTFSTQSHQALHTFKQSIAGFFSAVASLIVDVLTWIATASWSPSALFGKIYSLVVAAPQLPRYLSNGTISLIKAVGNLRNSSSPSSHGATVARVTLAPTAHWSAQDKIIAVVVGYVMFALAGALFMAIAHKIMGLKADEKLEGVMADRIREAGGVLKVIVIIGIEMIVFPLYCGLLLDLALLPLFEGATVQTRLAFIARAPFTGLFLHWFAGTCYMFHFALFVSMCRKILRKGVLYFIRDPDDPTFHPVRDVLERPVPTQLGKIAFSALVYGGLVIMCLGGVVWSIAKLTYVLPVRFTATHPRLAFPIDVVFFNVLLPFFIRKIKPSDKISAAYEWWFRGIAHGLRLSHFLFGDEREDEKKGRIRNGVLSWHRRGEEEDAQDQSQHEGTYVRAPASDFCRIPKNTKAFLEVDENNKRIDGAEDLKTGLHGYGNEKFAKIWLPPQFKPRMATCVVLLWLFAAGTGIGCTIGPLIVGRWVIRRVVEVDGPINDLYALTIGLHLMAGAAAVGYYSRPTYRWIQTRSHEALPSREDVLAYGLTVAQYVAGAAWVALTFGLILPLALSLLVELYIHVPIFAYLAAERQTSRPSLQQSDHSHGDSTLKLSAVLTDSTAVLPPTIYILQTWTLGLLYLRLGLKVAMNYPCRHARHAATLRNTYRNGLLRLDVRLLTRAFIIPLGLTCLALLLLPLGVARLTIATIKATDSDAIATIYRMSYPVAMIQAFAMYGLFILKNKLGKWRTMIRDEVYLVGERLHNYVNPSTDAEKSKAEGKGKGKVVPINVDMSHLDTLQMSEAEMGDLLRRNLEEEEAERRAEIESNAAATFGEDAVPDAMVRDW